MKKLLNLRELLEESAAMTLVGSDVAYDFNIPGDLWLVEADEERLDRMIRDLVINVLKARPQGGTVNISAGNRVLNQDEAANLSLCADNYVEIILAGQTGSRPEEQTAALFKLLPNDRESGHGLATAYTIIEEHRGRITFSSEMGKGTSFHIYLPASIGHLQVEDRACWEIPATAKGPILIVDDEPEIRRLLDTVLSRAGYQVEQTPNGEEAVAKYTSAKEAGRPFIAVIMDLTMPGGLGGREATEQILALDPAARVIVSSGYSADPVVYDFARYGFSGVVTKPYNIDQLEAELDRVISAGACIRGFLTKEQKSSSTELKKVLLMEDSELIRSSITDCFSDLNYVVEFARDGGETLSKYKAALESGCPFDVVIMDLTIRMGMGGTETMSRLLEIDPGAKAVITSGYTTEEVMLKPEKYGFKEALPKPYSIDELVRALERTANS